MYEKASRSRAGGALHSALLALAGLDADSRCSPPQPARRDALERVFNRLRTGRPADRAAVSRRKDVQ